MKKQTKSTFVYIAELLTILEIKNELHRKIQAHGMPAQKDSRLRIRVNYMHVRKYHDAFVQLIYTNKKGEEKTKNQTSIWVSYLNTACSEISSFSALGGIISNINSVHSPLMFKRGRIR
jgi:hypothetical protein